jgi:hypothetical protein
LFVLEFLCDVIFLIIGNKRNANIKFFISQKDQVKENVMGRACSMNGKRNAYMILVGNPEGKRPLGKPRCRCVDNIKMDLREIGWDGGD